MEHEGKVRGVTRHYEGVVERERISVSGERNDEFQQREQKSEKRWYTGTGCIPLTSDEVRCFLVAHTHQTWYSFWR